EDGYGWEKLFSERMCRHFREDFGVTTRVARFHNVYGPHGTYAGVREKAPAAISRKVIEAKLSGKHEIEIWGDGHQTRSFMYIDDCIKGTRLMVGRDIPGPLNIGSNELVSINQLVDIVEEIAGVRLKRTYNLRAPKGVKGRNSDNTRIQKIMGWQPSISLREGWRELIAGFTTKCWRSDSNLARVSHARTQVRTDCRSAFFQRVRRGRSGIYFAQWRIYGCSSGSGVSEHSSRPGLSQGTCGIRPRH